MALGENEVGADAIVDPDTGSVATAGSPGRVYLDNRFEIDPQRPIPQLDSPGGAAYAAVDVNASNRLLYALVLDGRVPVRARAMKSLRTTNSDLFVRPVQWGTVDWPGAKQRRFALMCTHPAGHGWSTWRVNPSSPSRPAAWFQTTRVRWSSPCGRWPKLGLGIAPSD